MPPTPSCCQHPHLTEFKDRELVQPGDIFASPAAFLDYTNARGKKWMFYFFIQQNSNPKEIPEEGTPITFSCSFSPKKCPNYEEIRERKKYRIKCPCNVVMKQVQGHNNNYFKVTDVCYHHNHELSSAMLAHLPRYFLSKHYKEMKEEIADLVSLDVDKTAIYKYMVNKSGFKFNRQIITNQIKAMETKNIQRHISETDLKSLQLKIKEINEQYDSMEKSENNKKHSTYQTRSKKPITKHKALLEYEETINAEGSPPLSTEETDECIERSRQDRISYGLEVMQSLQCSALDKINASPSPRYLTGINDPEEASYPPKVRMTKDCYDSRNELVSNQFDEDSQTVSEIVFEEPDVDNEVEVENTTVLTTDEEENSNTIPEGKNTKDQQTMVPERNQQPLKLYSEKQINETNYLKTSRIVSREFRKEERNLNKEIKGEAIKMPVIKIKSLIPITKSASVQENSPQLKKTIFNAQNKVPANIPVIKMNYQKFNANRISLKKGESMVVVLNKHGETNKVADSDSIMNNSNNVGEKKLGSDDVIRDENKLSYIAREVQRQWINDPSLYQPSITRRPYMPEVCNRHKDLVEFKDEELVKPGEIFASPAAFLDYTNARGKKWMFYFFVQNRVKPRDKPGARLPYVLFACCFSNSYTPKDKGLRKRKKYKTKCPCRVIMKLVEGQDHFKVTHVCYHHDHELSPAMLNCLPPRYLLNKQYKEMKEEVMDLASLDIDINTIYNYLVDKIGFKLVGLRQIIRNQIEAMKKRNVQRQFSAAELKSLLLKVKDINERHGPVEKNNKEKEQPTTSQTNSDEEPIKTYEQLLDYGKIIEAKEEAAKIKLLESMNKPKRIRNRKKRQPPVTEEKEECIKKSRLETSFKTQESEECEKKGRLESTLEKISSDSEVMQAVRDMHRSAVDEVNVSPWSTRHLIGIDDPEELSYPPKIYATGDSHDNGNELDPNQYHEDSHIIDCGEIFTEEIVIDGEIEMGNTTDHNIENQEVDGCGADYQNYTTCDESDPDEPHASIGVEDSNTMAQDNNKTAQDVNTIVDDVNTIVHDVNTIVDDVNTIVNDIDTNVQEETVHEFKNQVGTDNNELFETSKHRIESNSANFLDHYVKHFTETTSVKEENYSNVPKEFNSRMIEYCKIALQKLNNKTFANKGTQVDMTEQEIHTLKHLKLDDFIRAMRGDLKTMKRSRRRLSTDFEEDIINRHNIDLFIVQPNASTLMENLSKKMSMPIMDMLKSIYSDKAVISKINITDFSTDVNHKTLVYRLIDTPLLPERSEDDQNVKTYKEMCSDYLTTCVGLSRLVQSLSEENYELKKKLNGENDRNS